MNQEISPVLVVSVVVLMIPLQCCVPCMPCLACANLLQTERKETG